MSVFDEAVRKFFAVPGDAPYASLPATSRLAGVGLAEQIARELRDAGYRVHYRDGAPYVRHEVEYGGEPVALKELLAHVFAERVACELEDIS